MERLETQEHKHRKNSEYIDKTDQSNNFTKKGSSYFAEDQPHTGSKGTEDGKNLSIPL